jgi:hypothetical protein
MTKEMIQHKFSSLLELMALIQADIENGLFDVAARRSWEESRRSPHPHTAQILEKFLPKVAHLK